MPEFRKLVTTDGFNLKLGVDEIDELFYMADKNFDGAVSYVEFSQT